MLSQRELYIGTDYQRPSWDAIDIVVARAHAEQSREMARLLRAGFMAVVKGISSVWQTFEQAMQAVRLYDELNVLSDRQLKDIGIRREEISQLVGRQIFNNAKEETRGAKVMELPVTAPKANTVSVSTEHKLAA